MVLTGRLGLSKGIGGMEISIFLYTRLARTWSWRQVTAFAISSVALI
jgi:hypothetical protein